MPVVISSDTLNIMWLLLCSALVLLMQPGFTCLESGLVRTKNNVNVALKNVTDFCISGFCFWTVGFGIMYGESYMGLFGQDNFMLNSDEDAYLLSFFLFQMMFCGTATTIIAGAVAERMRFTGYIVCTIFTATLIFPVIGHWVWHGNFLKDHQGWLTALGFIDFAGATVVHSVGGWMGLALILIIGPRLGKYGKNGKIIEIQSQNIPLSALGTFLLIFGWFGFNGGSLLAIESKFALVFTNTALAACGGGLSAILLSWRLNSVVGIRHTLMGLLAGLVSITAGANLMMPLDAFIIGSVGGLLSLLVHMLIEKCKIDDAIGAVPVHLGGGIWGTLSVAIFPPLSDINASSRIEALGVQSIGILAAGAWAFGLSYILLKAFNYFFPFRVSAQTETIGLNYGEHGMRDELIDLMDQFDQMHDNKDISQGLNVDINSDMAALTMGYNRLLATVNKEFEEKEKNLLSLANLDPLTGIPNRRAFDDKLSEEWSKRKRKGKELGLMILDVDEFKKYNDHYGHLLGDYCLQNICQGLSEQLNRAGDMLARVGGEEFTVIVPNTSMKDLKTLAEKLTHSIEKLKIPHLESAHGVVTISIGIATTSAAQENDHSTLYQQADKALYRAKNGGRNRVSE